jgi:hypothetical protein
VFIGRERANLPRPQISASENRVGSLSMLKEIHVALWSKPLQARSLNYIVDFIFVLTGLFFVLLPRSITGGLAFRWFGACILSRGIFVLCTGYESFGPPIISAGILDRIALSFFGLKFIFAIDFAYSVFRRRVPKVLRLIQALNVAAVLLVQLDPASLYAAFEAVSTTSAIAISVIGAALAAMEFRKRSPGASTTFALFFVWTVVNTSYLLHDNFHLPTPVWIAASGFAISMLPAAPITGFGLSLGDAALFLWIPLIALQILRLNQQFQGERDRLRGEIEAAQQVQEVLLQSRVEHVPGFAVDTDYHPATEVGGDFFQLFPVPGDSLLLVIGDVSGKGMKAALLVSVIVGALQNRNSDEPATVLRELNAVLLGRSQGGFTTCCCALFAPEGALTIANAGHLAPYCNGHEIETPPGLPLGIDPDALWPELHTEVDPSDRIVWISDGVLEARNGKREILGFERAQELTSCSASDIARAAQRFGQDDDITVVSITRQAVAAYVA